MDLWLGILLGIVIGGLVALGVGVLISRRALAGTDPTQLTFDPALMTRVRDLAVAGQKIQAIALLRDNTPGLGLAAAKLMVDRMAAPRAGGTTVPAPADPSAAFAPDAALTADTVDSAALDDGTPSIDALALEVELEARNLKAQGKPIPAIKLIREHTGWGLKEAKDYVDRL